MQVVGLKPKYSKGQQALYFLLWNPAVKHTLNDVSGVLAKVDTNPLFDVGVSSRGSMLSSIYLGPVCSEFLGEGSR